MENDPILKDDVSPKLNDNEAVESNLEQPSLSQAERIANLIAELKVISTQLQALQERIAERFGSRDYSASLTERTLGLVDEVMQTSGFSTSPTFVLTCRPCAPVEVEGLFGGYREELVRTFDDPPSLREGGFDLSTSGRTSINVGGNYRLLAVSGYQARFLTRDGICGALVSGTSDFMGWAMNSQPGNVRFNPLTLVELTHSFCLFSLAVLAYAKPKPQKVRFAIQLKNYDAQKTTVSLPKIRLSQSRLVGSFQPSTLEHTDLLAELDANFTDDASESALRIVHELYVRSGLETDQVPYTDSSRKRIDVEAIKGGN